jgi:hypothetical protein
MGQRGMIDVYAETPEGKELIAGFRESSWTSWRTNGDENDAMIAKLDDDIDDFDIDGVDDHVSDDGIAGSVRDLVYRSMDHSHDMSGDAFAHRAMELSRILREAADSIDSEIKRKADEAKKR